MGEKRILHFNIKLKFFKDEQMASENFDHWGLYIHTYSKGRWKPAHGSSALLNSLWKPKFNLRKISLMSNISTYHISNIWQNMTPSYLWISSWHLVKEPPWVTTVAFVESSSLLCTLLQLDLLHPPRPEGYQSKPTWQICLNLTLYSWLTPCNSISI